MTKEIVHGNAVQLELASIRGWDKLKTAEQDIVRRETKELQQTIQDAGRLRLAIGEHLSRVRDVLGAKNHKGMWEKWLKTLPFGLSRSSANRYIQNYEVARTILPKPYMELALTRETGFLDRNMVAVNPPPKTRKKEEMIEYLDSLQKPHRASDLADDPEVMKREVYQYWKLRFDRLPSHHKTRAAWNRSLWGMMATTMGVSGEFGVTPTAVPDDFKPRPRGRPRKDGLMPGEAQDEEE